MVDFPHKLLLFLLLVVASGSVLSEPCTYGEAIMALEQGNTVRGMTLMRMANRDGDERANRYLAQGEQQIEEVKIAVRILPQQPLLSLNRLNP